MCGIIAYKGQSKCLSFLLDGLKLLEYRGYDSVGISFIEKNLLTTIKQPGCVDDLRSKIDTDIQTTVGMGHTRWATHGVPCKRNSHPHITQDNSLAIVHNGIIENYEELKKDLISYRFESDTDSEVLLYLIHSFMQTGIDALESVKRALNKVVGAYAMILLDVKNNRMIAARKGSPLVLGLGVHEIMVSSDSVAFGDRACLGIVYLKDNVVLEIKENLEIYDMSNGVEIDYEIEKVYNNTLNITKGNYESFMLKEIYEQPKTISDCLSGRLDGYRIKLGGLIGYENIFKKIDHITILACGSSWHASLLAKYYIEEFSRIKVSVEYSSEFRYRKPSLKKGDLVIGVSQSGETADTLGALEVAKECGCILMGICNVPNSSMSRLTDCGIFLKAGVEIGVASTKAFTNQVICLLLLSLWIEQNIGGLMSINYRRNIIDDLKYLPEIIQHTLNCYENIEFLSEQFENMKNCLFIGRGYNFPIALEGSLKLKEISYVHAEGYPAAEMKHGPLALIDSDMPVIVIANNYEHYNKLKNNIKEIQARKGKVITIGSRSETLGDFRVRVPLICDPLSPLVSLIPLQLFAYYSAKIRHHNVDKPRNLAKSVTVE